MHALFARLYKDTLEDGQNERERERFATQIKFKTYFFSLFHHHTRVQEVDLNTVFLEIIDQG